MIKIRQLIIVEGKYDKIKLESILDGKIITTNGFGIYKDKEKLDLIRKYAAKTGVIILTDSDSAGFQLRNFLKSSINNGEIFHVYIPDIFGKERRKLSPSKEGKLGVEGVSKKVILEAFSRAGIEEFAAENGEIFTRGLLMESGLIGGENSALLRKKLQKKLGLPELMSVTSLIEALNTFCSLEKYNDAIKEITVEED